MREWVYFFVLWLLAFLTVSWALRDFFNDDDCDEMTMHFRFFTKLYKKYVLCCHHHQTPPFKTKSVAFIKIESVLLFRVCAYVRVCIFFRENISLQSVFPNVYVRIYESITVFILCPCDFTISQLLKYTYSFL